MDPYVSPKLLARAIGVSESSIKRWCDRGLLETVRTAGGHRRMRMNSVMAFLRQTGQPLIDPELLGLPARTGTGEHSLVNAQARVAEALMAGDETRFRQLVLDLYLAGHSAVELFDRVLTAAMHEIGSRWEHQDLEIYQERRGCEIVLRFLYELRGMLPVLAPDAPFALGGTFSSDPYKIATTMVELVLREAGWRAESYGTNLPFTTLSAALFQTSPKLCWISVSYLTDPHQFLAEYAPFATSAQQQGTALVVGGRALTPELRREMQYSAYCDTFAHVAQFARALYVPPSQQKQPDLAAESATDAGEIVES